jgi:hypothetical protein
MSRVFRDMGIAELALNFPQDAFPGPALLRWESVMHRDGPALRRFSVVWPKNAGMQPDVDTESDEQPHRDHEYQGEPSRYCAGGCGTTILETV